MILPLSVPNAPWLLRSLASAVKSLGHQLEVMDNGVDPDEELQALPTMTEQRVDAIVLMGDRDPAWPANEELVSLHNSGLPCVAVSIRLEDSRVPFVVRLGGIRAAFSCMRPRKGRGRLLTI